MILANPVLIAQASRSLVTFIDLAGHEKYLKTTIAGCVASQT
jgi:GTPase